MVDYISLERIWQDENFFQIGVECVSQSVVAKSCSYATNESIEMLIEEIGAFLDGTVDSFYWINGEKGNAF